MVQCGLKFKFMQNPSCNLCTITSGIVARGELWTMVVNSNQTLLGRCYFALNRHLTDATEITDSETLALHDWFRRSKIALDRLFAPDHYNFVLLMNVEPHVHAHIIPRYTDIREFAGQKFDDLEYGGHYNPESEQFLDDPSLLLLRGMIAMELVEGNRT